MHVSGVAYFNAKNGCQKCTTLGEYNHISGTTVFPRTDCEKRTDENFRNRMYGTHHKKDSPLLSLHIDMIEQFPVGDCLHLLHLGMTKRLLFGWRDGKFRRKREQTKWRASTTQQVSDFLLSCKMPVEFQRKVRGLDDLANWKGTEYRMFLHYIGIVVLKDHLTPEAYVHFLLLFCGVTICSSKRYFHLLGLARTMFNIYIDLFKNIYGVEYVTSNVHNLSHLVDEVERYGELHTFSAYAFETLLGKIKRSLRSGNKPLEQAARRIIERNNNVSVNYAKCDSGNSEATASSYPQVCAPRPILSKANDGENVPTLFRAAI